MTRSIEQIVDESYRIFCLAKEKFDSDKRRWSNMEFHYTWPCAVAEMAEKILLNERIEESQGKRYGASQSANEMIGVILSGNFKIDLEKNEEALKILKNVNFKMDPASKTWQRRMRQSSWGYLKVRWPFAELDTKVTP